MVCTASHIVYCPESEIRWRPSAIRVKAKEAQVREDMRRRQFPRPTRGRRRTAHALFAYCEGLFDFRVKTTCVASGEASCLLHT